VLRWFLLSAAAAMWTAGFFGLGYQYGIRRSDREWKAAIAKGREEENRRRRERRAAQKSQQRANSVESAPESATTSRPPENREQQG
jgi:hypothetical protein